jgi:4-hydroxybenzoate polyprenyltransferase/phosphoserine phosphatase
MQELKTYATGSADAAAVSDEQMAASARPLCVDLDGTLVKSDTLIDSLLVLVRQSPLNALRTPKWALEGKARLKSKVTDLISLDVAHLPYNRPLLAYLESERGKGRKIYLATGADTKLAVRIANYLGIFEGVLASDGKTNLTGNNKLNGFRERFGEQGFDYIGNARPDLPLLQHAAQPMTANPDGGLRSLLRKNKVRVTQNFEDRRPFSKSLLKAIRLHQWAKNVLIFVPFLLAHALSAAPILRALLAFLCFSLTASATYIVNDLLDIEADRRHPRKSRRPFASGDLSAKTGALISLLFLGSSIAAAAVLLPAAFLGWLLLYLVSTLSYSLYFKRIVLVDVVLLSGLYTLRLLAGGAAAIVFFSPWLAGFSIFLFLSLAMVKRFSELQNTRARGNAPSSARGYLLVDIEQLRTFGTSSAFAAIVVFILYISSLDVMRLYPHPSRLWLVTPLMILWMCRVWLLAGRGEMDEDPVIFAVTDRMSLLIGLAVAVVAVAAAF